MSDLLTRRQALFAAPAAIIAAQANGQDTNDISADVIQRTQWFYTAKWGVFVHYLGEPGTSANQWNRRIQTFNVEGLATQLANINAGYLIFSVGQNSGHFASPNAVYDELVGETPSKCSKRDLILDLAYALRKRNIRLLAYMPAGAPQNDPLACSKLQWRIGAHPNKEFQRKWEQVIQFYSDQWKDAVSGWWFDGCFWPNTMYRGGAPNFQTFASAARHGNAQSILAFNPGVENPIRPVTAFEDYTAGETDDPGLPHCTGRWVDGVNFHLLSYLGSAWSRGPLRFEERRAVTLTTNFTWNGGNVTWDVPTDSMGIIDDTFMTRLHRIGSEVALIKR